MSPRWRWFLPGYLVTLPLTIAALGYALIVGGYSFRWERGCLTFLSPRLIGRPGGQSWSPVIGFADETQRARRDLQCHERCHVWQAMAIQTVAPTLVYLWLRVDLPWGWDLWGVSGLGIFPPVIDVLWCLASIAPFAFVYGGLFARYYFTTQKDERAGWHDDYMRNPLERHAYAKQDTFLGMSPARRAEVWT